MRAALLGWMTPVLAALSAAFINWLRSSPALALSPAKICFSICLTTRLKAPLRFKFRSLCFSLLRSCRIADLVLGISNHP